MKTTRKYKVVKTDLPGFLKFTCVDVPRAHALYIEKTALPRKARPKMGDTVKFKRRTTRTTTRWVIAH
jgi:hypothetical protein